MKLVNNKKNFISVGVKITSKLSLLKSLIVFTFSKNDDRSNALKAFWGDMNKTLLIK